MKSKSGNKSMREESEPLSREMDKSKHRARLVARCARQYHLGVTLASERTAQLVLGLSVSCCIWLQLLLITNGGGGGVAAAATAQPNSVWPSQVPTHHSLSGSVAVNSQRCSSGPPLQWRPHLDAPSKAYLAPVVALGTLIKVQIVPIGLNGAATKATLQQQLSLAYHPQNINNVGFYIEATFLIKNLIKKASHQTTNITTNQIVKLHYKISASLATTNALMTLVNSNRLNQRTAGFGSPDLQVMGGVNLLDQPMFNVGSGSQQQQQLLRQQLQQLRQVQVHAPPCAYELSEQDMRKANKMFQNQQNYILFLDQSTQITTMGAIPAVNNNALSQQAIINSNWHKPQANGPQVHLYHPQSNHLSKAATTPRHDLSVQPFAPHEPVSNQTSRAIRKILFKDCGKFQSVSAANDNHKILIEK